MFFLKLSWYQQCLVAHFNLTISSNNNFWQFFGLGTVCLCCNVCYCDKQQEKEYIVFILVMMKNKRLLTMQERQNDYYKQGLGMPKYSIWQPHPFELFREPYKLQFH